MRLISLALVAFAAFGQTTKVFRLTQNQSRQQLTELAVLLHWIADVPKPPIDDSIRTLTVNGTDSQIGLASWLIQRLDLPPNTPLGGVNEYRSPDSDAVVRVFYANNAATPQALQEIVTTIRSLGDIQRLFVYNSLHAVAARGTAGQIALAAWLVDQLNLLPGVAAPEPHEFKYTDKFGDDVARVFELTNSQTPQQLQQIVTLIRSVADVMRIFVNNQRHAIALRSRPDHVALAAWLVSELDKPADSQPVAQQGAAPHEYRLPDDPQNVVRVFYLPPAESQEDFQKLATRLRDTTKIRRLFVYDPLAALAMRGTADEIASAEKLLDQPKPQ
jgi:hypothetical protein